MMLPDFLRSLLKREEPPLPPERILEGALQTLKNHKYQDFVKNTEAYLSAFDAYSKRSPLQAIKLLMLIEKERPSIRAEEFFKAATPRLIAVINRCNPHMGRDLYSAVLETAPDAQLADFILAQKDQLARLITGELGARLTKKILEHAAPRQKEILEAFEKTFEGMISSLKDPLFTTKQICKAYRQADMPLPPKLAAMRAKLVKESADIAVKQTTCENPNFQVAGGELAKIIGLGIFPTDKIKAFKGPSMDKSTPAPTKHCPSLILFKIDCANSFNPNAPQFLYALCAGSKSSIESGKLTVLIADHDLAQLKRSFSKMGRSSAEVSALNNIVASVNEPQTSYSLNMYQPNVRLSVELHPIFAFVSQLTQQGNRVDLSYAQSSDPYRWNLLPLQHYSAREVQ